MRLHELAEAAGVSKSTVSRVLNQSSRVAPDVAEHVLKAMERIGYRAPIKRSTIRLNAHRGVRTGNLMLLVANRNSSPVSLMGGYPSLLHGIEMATRANGMKLLLAGFSPDGITPAALSHEEVDGVLLFGAGECLSSDLVSILSGIPVVGLMRGFEQFKSIDQVTYDNHSVGPMAADYLIDRGHKRVAFVNVNPEHTAFGVRMKSFTVRAEAAGLEVVHLVTDQLPHGFREETAVFRNLAARLCDPVKPITGAFVAIDFQIPPLYQALDACGVIPGKDIEIIGCDNAPQFLDRLSPRPATLDINLELVGYRGVEQLLWRMGNSEIKNQTKLLIEPVLVPAETDAE